MLDLNFYRIKTNEIIINSLSVRVGLAWQSAFDNLFTKNKLLHKWGPWIYAILLTGIIVTIIYFLQPPQITHRSGNKLSNS